MAERCYVVYGPSPWDGHRNAAHNYAHALAMHHRVLYVDPPVSPLSPIRYGLRPATWPRLRAVADRRVRTVDDVAVFAPLSLPPVEHPQVRSLSLPLVRRQIANAVSRAGLRAPVLLAWRGLADLAGVAGETLRVAVVMDHPAAGAALLDRDPNDLEAQNAAACHAADVIFATSHPVQQMLGERGFASELVPFGFPGDLAGLYDAAEEPSEYASLPRPLLGYTGSIDDRLDFELITDLADRFSRGSLVLVGAVSPRLSEQARDKLTSHPNIHLLGNRSRTQLPGYIRHLDVALLPYKDGLFTRHQSPMKVWEYFYAGPSIVGTASPELRYYPPPLVNYADNAGAVSGLVERALADPATGREQRRQFALVNTWEDRAAQIDALVQERLANRCAGLALSAA